MAMICFCTHSARGRKYEGDEDDFAQLAGGGTVWQRMQCRSKGSFGWCRLKLRKVGIGIGWSWPVDQFPPTLLHSTILTSDPCQGDGVGEGFHPFCFSGADWQGSRRLLECGLCRERHRGRL